MKSSILFLGLFMVVGLKAQQLDKSAFPIAGVSSGSSLLTASAGEVVGGSFESDLFYLGYAFQNSTGRVTTSAFFEELGSEIQLFPNPTTDQIFVSFSSIHVSDIFEYQIINLWGQEIQRGQLDGSIKNRLDGNLLPPGKYYLRVSKSERSQILPFIVTK